MRQILDSTSEFMSVLAASRLSGVSEHLIRIWERRYQAIHPSRSENGRRVFQNADVMRLRYLKQLTDVGYSISKIASLSSDQLAELFQKSSTLQSISDHSEKTDQAFDFLKHYRLDVLASFLERSEKQMGVRNFLLDFVVPFFAKVGVATQKDELSIAHEHVLSALLRDHLGRLLYSLGRPDDSQQVKIAFATREGDLHEFGILIGAVLAALHGYKVYYFGPNMPAKALSLACASLQCQHLVVSFVFSTTSQHLNSRYVDELLEGLGSDVRVIVGGPGCVQMTDDKHSKRVLKLGSLHSLDDCLKSIPSLNL